MSRLKLILLSVCFLLAITQTSLPQTGSIATIYSIPNEEPTEGVTSHTLSSTSSTTGSPYEYVVVELPGGSISSHGADLSLLLNESGLVSRVVSMAQVLGNPSILSDASVIILDGSIGSNNGTAASEEFLDMLISEDRPLLLVGRSAWISHRIRGSGSPSLTCSASTYLYTASGFESAVFLASPVPLTLSSQISSETGLSLPLDTIQTENSRLINLTSAASPVEIPALRYDSYPLDMFLFGPENPNELTTDGRGLLINTVAFATSLRESNVTRELESWQVQDASPLEGGFHFPHEATIEDAYYATHMIHDLLNVSAWSSWQSDHQALIETLLNSTIVDYGTESGFKKAASSSASDLESTAQGLWLISTMDLSASFNIDEIVAYISSRQDASGGFDDDVIVTYEVTEALQSAGRLGSIDVNTLETWLRDCVIDGSKTSDPTLWGGVAKNPSSTSPTNSRARAYVLSLGILGKTHDDPVKLTDWIQKRTANGDGSYSDSMTSGVDVSIGTGSALTTMEVLGTLSSQNRTTGLQWLAGNQVPSGGFGFGYRTDDLVGKTYDTSYVSCCLAQLGETSGPTASGIIDYVASIETPLGFERMDPAPTLMWTDWMMQSARYSHSAAYVDYDSVSSFLSLLEGWKMYPSLPNMSFLAPLEYGPTQYRIQSVWTHYFGTETSLSVGRALTTAEVDETTTYLTNAQLSSGHFRPTMFTGIASMQHSVVAVETLYQIGRLDQVPYRSELESAILSEYQGGTWSGSGWDLRPFDNIPTAIDWLSTRAALRLGLLNSSMVSEIVSSIQGRIQYQDLLALSYDVATLALLEANGYNASVSIVDKDQVLSELGPDPFSNGWFNSTTLWQPLYTSSILRMISILGIRPTIFEGHACSLSASLPSVSVLGGTITINVSITSGTTNHSLALHAFGSWTVYSNLSDSDTLTVAVPSTADALGLNDLYLVAVDYGSVRASERLTIEIDSALVGTLSLTTDEVRIGDKIAGDVTWELNTSMPAGLTNISVRLESTTLTKEWLYSNVSPFTLSVPTDGFDAGPANLTVTLSHSYCEDSVLSEGVQLYTPVPTYIESDSSIETTVNHPLLLNWTLRYSGNDTAIAGEEVTLQIRDDNNLLVYNSSDTSGQFTWVPTVRGNYSFMLQFDGERSLCPSNHSGIIHVYEPTAIDMQTGAQYDQYSNVTLSVILRDSDGTPLADQSVTLVLQSPSSVTVAQEVMVTDSNGRATLEAYLSENGPYTLTASFDASDYYLSSTNSSVFISFSSTDLALEGISLDGHVGTEYSMYVNLTDSASYPVVGSAVHVTITYLPSTVVAEYDLTTDSAGVAYFSWTATSAGSYVISASFAGTSSYGDSSDSESTDMWIPVTLTIIVYDNPEVSILGWITVTAEDHLGDPISGLALSLMVTPPSSIVDVQTTGTTSDGVWTVNWTPSERGLNNITATCDRQNWYEASNVTRIVGVYETPTVTLSLGDSPVAPGTTLILIEVRDNSSSAVSSCSVHTVVSLNDRVILDVTNETDASGRIVLDLELSEPGALEVTANVPQQNWFLSTPKLLTDTVRGTTTLVLTTPGQPVVQGSGVGLLVELTDWAGDPVANAPILYEIMWDNGTMLHSESRTTGADGTCVLVYNMVLVGDFLINASYSGSETNAPSSQGHAQRVYVTPDVIAQFESICYLNGSLEIYVGVEDAFNQLVPGRALHVSIDQGGITVFETDVLSETNLVLVSWSPSSRGVAVVHVLHAGDLYYYTNETQGSTSIMEIVTASLGLSDTTIEFKDYVNLTYTLDSIDPFNVSVVFQVLGIDLIPLWTTTVKTNGSGFAIIEYHAVEATGILTVRVGPAEDQFMLGGDIQQQITVMTDAQVDVVLSPDPPCAGESINITIHVFDELGVPLDGLYLTVSALDPYGEPIQLGSWSNSISVETVDGLAIVPMTSDTPGLHTIEVQFSGSTYVHSFDNISQSVVFSRTSIELVSYSDDLEAGECFLGLGLLTNHADEGMSDIDVSMTIYGPNDLVIGPQVLTTNSTGYFDWNVTLDSQGVYHVVISFDGAGVYLPCDSTMDVDVRYHVILSAEVISSETPVAGRTPVNISLLMTDMSETVLEGFTVTYSVYHETEGLVLQDSVIQTDTDPMNISLLLLRGGHYSILVEFAGTSHYYPASVALTVFVYGTVSVQFDGPLTIEISQPIGINATFLDESGQPLNVSGEDVMVELIGPGGSLVTANRTQQMGSLLHIDLAGLPVGPYNLTVTTLSTTTYIGCSQAFLFNMTSRTQIVELVQDLSGVVGVKHTLTFVLQDSFGRNLTDLSVVAYVYDPSGKELLGGIFQQGILLQLTDAGAEVMWTPSAVGVYAIDIVFTGDGYLLSSSLEIEVLTRFSTVLKIDLAHTVSYGDDILILATIRDEFGAMRNVPVEAHVLLDGVEVQLLNETSDWNGVVKFGLHGLLAGNYTVTIEFSGSDDHVPVQKSDYLEIDPVISLQVLQTDNAYQGQNASAIVTISVLGVGSMWTGHAQIVVIDPSGVIIHKSNHSITSQATLSVSFVPPDVGQYRLELTVSDVPVLDTLSDSLRVDVSAPADQLMIDSSTGSLAIGLPIIALVGLLIHKKTAGALRSLPTDWHFHGGE